MFNVIESAHLVEGHGFVVAAAVAATVAAAIAVVVALHALVFGLVVLGWLKLLRILGLAFPSTFSLRRLIEPTVSDSEGKEE